MSSVGRSSNTICSQYSILHLSFYKEYAIYRYTVYHIIYDVYDILYKISFKLENSGGPSVTERHGKTFK